MSRISLLRTTVFRASLLYAVFYSLLAAVLLSFIYWSMTAHVRAETDNGLKTEASDLAYLFRGYSRQRLSDAVRRYSSLERQDGRYYLLMDSHGKPLAGDLEAWPATAGLSPGWYTQQLHYKPFQVRGWDDDDDYRVRSYVVALNGGDLLAVAQGLHAVENLSEYTSRAVLGSIVMTALAALFGGYLLGQAVLRRIDTISHTAGEIMSGDLARRIPYGQRNDEFDELAARLNAMLDRIEQLMTGMRQVTDNVAHDLRGPLTRLRNRLEVTLLEPRGGEEYHRAIEQTIADADTLLKTFNALLSIAQAEAGVRRNDWSDVDLNALAADIAELYEAVAEEKEVEFTWHTTPGAHMYGNRHLLAQALSNLLDNAMKYTPPGGRVSLDVNMVQGAPEVLVTDDGPGIPTADRERVLERFVRLDSARTSPGNGLGLSLVRAVARLHGADLKLEDNQPGLRVRLRFPPPTDTPRRLA